MAIGTGPERHSGGGALAPGVLVLPAGQLLMAMCRSWEQIQEAKLDFQTHSRWTILSKIQSDLEFAAEWLPVTAKPGVITKGAANHLLTKVYLANLEYDKAIETANKVINGPYALMTQRFGIDAAKGNRNLIWDLHRAKNFSIAQNTETILAAIDRY